MQLLAIREDFEDLELRTLSWCCVWSAFLPGLLVVIMSRNVRVISVLHSDLSILTKYFANDGSLKKK